MKKPPVDRKKRIVNRIIRCAVLIMALLFYLVSVHTYFRYESIKARTVQVESQVIYIDERTDENGQHKDVYVEYFYDGELYGFLYDEAHSTAYAVGDPVLIYIDPMNPQKHVDTSKASTTIILWCLGGAILMAVFIAMNERKASADYCTVFSLTRTYIHADLCRKLRYDRSWLIPWMLAFSAGGLCYLCFQDRKALIGTAIAAGIFLSMAAAATWQHCKIAGSIKRKDYRTKNVRVIQKEVQEDVDSTDYVAICVPEENENERYTVRMTRKEYALVEGGDEMLIVRLSYKDMPYLCISLKDKKVFYRTGRKRRK